MSDADIFDQFSGDFVSARRSEAIRLHPLVTFGSQFLYLKYPSITTKYLYINEENDSILDEDPPHTTKNVVVRINPNFYISCMSLHFIHPNINNHGNLCVGKNWLNEIKRSYYVTSIEALYFIIQDWLSTSNTADIYGTFNESANDTFWKDGRRCIKCKKYASDLITNQHNITLCSHCEYLLCINFYKLKSLSGIKRCEYCHKYDYTFKFRNKRHVRC